MKDKATRALPVCCAARAAGLELAKHKATKKNSDKNNNISKKKEKKNYIKNAFVDLCFCGLAFFSVWTVGLKFYRFLE